MKRQVFLGALAALCPLFVLARGVRVHTTETLVERSALVFVGRVFSVEPSGIKTHLGYPTWRDATFEWLRVGLEVLEPIKGVRRGEQVSAAMLSVQTKWPGGLFNGPGTLEPTEGTVYLLCLLPTTISNVFAAFTAPWDEQESVLILDRKRSPLACFREDNETTRSPGYAGWREHAVLIWSLVDERGLILTNGVEQMRRAFEKEINTPPVTDAVIHLQWETWTAPDGWRWDVPKGYGNATNTTGSPASDGGPITLPSQDR